jgi:hypothetical protein
VTAVTGARELREQDAAHLCRSATGLACFRYRADPVTLLTRFRDLRHSFIWTRRVNMILEAAAYSSGFEEAI